MVWESLGISLLGAGIAYYHRDLTGDGFWGALAVGFCITYFGGWNWLAILAAFFISANALSHWGKERKQAVEKYYAKTRPRDLGQVLANGGLGALLAGGYWLLGGRPVFYILYLGVMATVTADTWATEVGVLGKGRVFSLRSGRIVPPGESGGVSLLGTAAALLGALLIGLIGEGLLLLTGKIIIPGGYSLLAATVGGMVGCFLDSLLGAWGQARFRCPDCGLVTEKREHCQIAGEQAGGWSRLDNDWVNGLSSLAGGVAALGFLWWIIGQA